MDPLIPLEIVPRVGIGQARLGMNRVEVESALASVCRVARRRDRPTIDHYPAASLKVEFDEDGTASFIEASGSAATLCTYKGRDVFDVSATQLFAILAADDTSGPHAFAASGYLFPDLIVALWEADEQYDRKGNESRPVYATVGVGDERYLANCMKRRRSAPR